MGIGDVVFHAGVLTDAAHRHAMRTVTPQILDIDIGRVRFRREAVVSHIDTGVCDGEAIYIQGVKAICVLGQRRGVGGHCVNVNIVECNILCPYKKVGPARGVFEMQASDLDVGGVVGQEENGTVERVTWIQYLCSCKAVPPCLTIPIDDPGTVDLDVLSAPDPERDALLEGVIEVVGLPIVDIICELSASASVHRGIVWLTYFQLPFNIHIDIFQKRQI